MGALAADCGSGAAANKCTPDKCESVGDTQICTNCEATFVPINGQCVAKASNEATSAGCTQTASSDAADQTCGKCGANYFLFMGGCYKAGQTPGSEICTAASEGKCTACKTDNGLFKNPANPSTPGSECILCWDTTGADKYKGVENCNTCQAPNTPGPAKCDTCQDGYYKDGQACTQCADTCATCKTDANTCISCPKGKYLKGNTCGADCGDNTYYPDPVSRKCISCSAATSEGGIEGCTACKYNATVSKPQCTACLEGKYLDGNTCIDASSCKGAKYPDPKTNKCIQCATDIPECTACTYSSSLQKPVCSACGGSKPLLKTAADGTTTCEADCGDGYFQHIATSGSNLKTCQSCSAPKDGLTPAVTGIPGCTQCTYTENTNTLKCTACGSGYKLEGGACVSASANKSGLSTGAIAGISVAAVVVVGGLVGFLCWWFICRGKA